jgi:hypothetical protein
MDCHPERSGSKRSAAATQSKDLVSLATLDRPEWEFSSARDFSSQSGEAAKSATGCPISRVLLREVGMLNRVHQPRGRRKRNSCRARM